MGRVLESFAGLSSRVNNSVASRAMGPLGLPVSTPARTSLPRCRVRGQQRSDPLDTGTMGDATRLRRGAINSVLVSDAHQNWR
jgi:hypothetical protein